jgi:hypothetical protein
LILHYLSDLFELLYFSFIDFVWFARF